MATRTTFGSIRSIYRRFFASSGKDDTSASRPSSIRPLQQITFPSSEHQASISSPASAPHEQANGNFVPSLSDLYKAVNTSNAELKVGFSELKASTEANINDLKADINGLKADINELKIGVKNLNLGVSEVAKDSRMLPFMAAINSGSFTRTLLGDRDLSSSLLEFTDQSLRWPTLDSSQLLERHFYLSFVESILGGLSVEDKPMQIRAAILGSPGIGTSHTFLSTLVATSLIPKLV
jgi:hypothetical protein